MLQYAVAVSGFVDDVVVVEKKNVVVEDSSETAAFVVDGDFAAVVLIVVDFVALVDDGVVADAAFELYQNEPNPFNDITVIGFELPATSEATLSVYDVTGKVIYTRVDTYSKGLNTVTINRESLPAVGVLYYKLENGENVATKKMIVLE